MILRLSQKMTTKINEAALLSHAKETIPNTPTKRFTKEFEGSAGSQKGREGRRGESGTGDVAGQFVRLARLVDRAVFQI